MTPIAAWARSVQEAALLNGTETVLRGGAYDLVIDPRHSPETIGKWITPDTFQPHLVTRFGPDGNPCQTEADRAADVVLMPWDETDNDFSAFFTRMRQTRCNFPDFLRSLRNTADEPGAHGRSMRA
ncbi:MAG TPA: hypothetical protein VHG28_16205 [Longimicrobiaceae bacterium]|nr:hypothetical protein [Longimicrobiaceae bacterium]